MTLFSLITKPFELIIRNKPIPEILIKRLKSPSGRNHIYDLAQHIQNHYKLENLKDAWTKVPNELADYWDATQK
jgi:hypothetical protein